MFVRDWASDSSAGHGKADPDIASSGERLQNRAERRRRCLAASNANAAGSAEGK
jgi:hypothetical protein